MTYSILSITSDFLESGTSEVCLTSTFIHGMMHCEVDVGLTM